MKTMKYFATFFVFYLLFIQTNFAQNIIKPIDYRFKGKEQGFIDFVQNNIVFPTKSLDENTVGYSISSITITPEGTIEKISILNSIDESIDSEVTRLLKISKKHWKKNDTIKSNQTFYVQIVFMCTGYGLNVQIGNPIEKNIYFLEPITITAYSLNQKLLPISDDSLAIKYGNLISLKKFEEALPFLNDLIKRNPFNKDLYQYRIMIYNKTNRKELIDEDLRKISNFIPGVSLDDLLKN
jgi:hypothetical protein